jgi:hypothetical protein
LDTRSKIHGGATHAVKFLAVVSALLFDVPLRESKEPSQEGVSIVCESPRTHLTCISGKQNWSTALISASDGRKLPLKTPNELLEMHSTYPDLKGIGLNARTEALSRGPVKIWWVSF